jgi:hypothetical protein
MSAINEIIVRQCDMCGSGISKPKRGPVGNTCSAACKQRLYRLKKTKPVTPHANHQKTCDTPSAGAYAASNIVILDASERMSNPMFDWELAEDLAHEFTRPVEWIKRSISACREAGVSPEYFIDRYILRKSIPMNEEVHRVALTYW